MSLHYLTVTPSFEYAVSNIDTYAVCFSEEQTDANIASVVYNNRESSPHSIVSCLSGEPLTLLQRYTDLLGNVENIANDMNNHVYMVSLIDATKTSDARNVTMKQVVKLT